MEILQETACAECQRLWQALADAAGSYVRIIQDHKAIPARARPAIPATQLKAAGKRRLHARKALDAHDATHRRAIATAPTGDSALPTGLTSGSYPAADSVRICDSNENI